MDVLTDDHEREEAVKKWWHEYWIPITLGIVLALAIMLGWRWYQSYVNEQNQGYAFELYSHQQALAANGTKALPQAETFIKEHDDIYGSLLALDAASVQAAAGDFAGAAERVDFAARNGGELIKPAADLARARLQAAAGKFEEALQSLDQIKSEAYTAEIAEVRGDILLQQGDADGAHNAYQQALKYAQDHKLPVSPVLQMKFDSVIKAGDKPAYQLLAQ